MQRIGIECESIEGKNPSWGIGRIITKLLEEISRRPELEKDFRFILYFKDNIPKLSFLNSPVFIKKKTPVPFFKNKLFPLYYFALLPIRLWFERLDLMFWPNYMLPIIAFNKSLVLLTEDIYHEAHNGKLPFRYRLAYKIFAWWSAKFANKILTISETSKKNLSRFYGINSHRIIVNYLGIEFKKPTSADTENNGPYILFVGQAFPRRHLKESLLAFGKISANFPSFGFKIVGPDKYETPTVKPLISEINAKIGRNAITQKEYVEESDLIKLYINASALVYVSDREAFGLPPMEALSFGVPPIIADNELGRELFKDYAFYAKSPDLESISQSMNEALTKNDKINKIKSEGPEFTTRYSWRKFTDIFIKELKNNKL